MTPLSPAPALTAEACACGHDETDHGSASVGCIHCGNCDEYVPRSTYVSAAVFDAAEEPEEVTVERVARAIYEADSGNPWEDCWLPSRWHTAARAALAALRGDRAPLAGQHTTDEEGR